MKARGATTGSSSWVVSFTGASIASLFGAQRGCASVLSCFSEAPRRFPCFPRCSRGQMRGVEKGGGLQASKMLLDNQAPITLHLVPPPPPHHSTLHIHGLVMRACSAGGVGCIHKPTPPLSKSPPLPSCLSSFCGGEDSTGGGQEGVSGGAAKTKRARRQT